MSEHPNEVLHRKDHEALRGGCLCGAVSYECSTQPQATMLCHCEDCQRYTGTAYATLCFFPKSDVQLTGELQGFDIETDSGNVMTRSFCPNCGTHITENSTLSQEHVAIPVGSFDNPAIVKPSAHCWTKRMLPWVEGIADLPKFEGNPPM